MLSGAALPRQDLAREKRERRGGKWGSVPFPLKVHGKVLGDKLRVVIVLGALRATVSRARAKPRRGHGTMWSSTSRRTVICMSSSPYT